MPSHSGRDGGVALAGELADFVEMLPSVLFTLEALDALRFRFFDFSHFAVYPVPLEAPKNKKAH